MPVELDIAGGALTANTLNTTAGGILNMGTYSHYRLAIVANNGTIRTQNTSSTPIPSGLTWGGTVIFDGSGTQTVPASTFNNFTVNNSSGLTLSGVVTVDGTLTLTSGILATTSSYYIWVNNTSSIAITGYSSLSYVNGGLRWSLATGGSYFFPVGDALYYRPFEMNSITCSSPVVQVNMSSTGATQPDNITMSSVFPRNWYAQLESGSFTSATIRITESGLVSTDAIGQSTSQSGTYASVGGNNIGSTITSNAGIAYTGSKYFAIGSICGDPTSGGTIAAAQEGCTPFTPALLTNSADASGYVGTLVYKWQSSTTGSGSGFSDISGATSATYQPGSLTVNTWYQRLASVDCLNDWPVSSNVLEMTVDPLPTPVISGPTAACANSTGNTYSTTSVTGHTYSWSISGGSIVGSTTGNSITVTWGAAGSGWVQVTETITATSCAVTTAEYSVTINALPTATISYAGSPYCATGTGTVTQTGQTGGIYSSTTGLVIGASTGTIDLVASTPGTYTVTYSFTDINNCSNTTTTGVTINALPTATISYAGSPYCATGTGTVTQTGQTGGTYSSTTGLVIGASTGTIDLVASTPGTYTVTYSFTDINNCSNTTTTGVTIYALPTATISYAGSPYCATGTGTVTQTGQTGGTYSSTTGLVIGASTGTIDLVASTPGTYTVTYSFTDINNCSNTTTTGVTIYALPTATISYEGSPYCATGTGTVTQSGQTGGTYSSTTGLVIDASTGTIDLVASTPGTYTVTYSFTDINNCSNTTTTGVTINALPVPTINGPGAACLSSINNNYYTETEMTGYSWSVTGGTITSGSGTYSIEVTWNTVGSESVSVNYNDLNGCTAASATVYPVTVNDLPIVSAATMQNSLNPTGPWSPMNGTLAEGYNMCLNPADPFYYLDINNMTASQSLMTSTLNPFTLSQTGLPGDWFSYWAAKGVVSGATGWQGIMWNIINGNAPIFYIYYTGSDYQLIDGLTYQTGGGLTPLRVSGDYPQGTYTYSGTVTDVNGCVSLPFNVQTTFNTVPVPALSGPTPVCLNSTGNVYVTDAGMSNYIWIVSAGGSITAGGGSGDNSVTVTWTSATPQSVSVNYTDGKGCTAGSATVYPVTVNLLPTATINYDRSPYCATGTGTVTQTGQAGGTYSSTSGLVIDASTGTIDLVASVPGTYTVTYSFGNGTCSNTTTTGVTIYALPTAMINYDGSPYCATGTGTVTQTGQAGGIYSSTTGLVIDGITGNIDLGASTPGTYTVTYNFNDANCSNTTTTSVTIYALPTATINYEGSPYCAVGTGTVTQTGQAGGTYSSTSGLVIDVTTGDIDLVASTPGTYTVTYSFTDINNCSNTTTTDVTINALPTATINYDGSPYCATGTGMVTQTGQAGGTYTSTSGLVIDASTGTIDLVASTPGTYTVTYSFSDNNNCSNSTTANVTIYALPIPSITGPTSVCLNSTGNIYTTESGMTGYVWNVSSGGTVTAGGGTGDNSVTVTWTSATPQSISVNYIDDNGCTAVSATSQSITVNSLPVVTISGSASVCLNSTETYTTASGMTNYSWAVSSGGSITAGGGTGDNSVTVNWTSATPQTIGVNYVDGNGCSAASPTVYNVTVNALPIPTLTGPTPVCVSTTGNVYVTDPEMTNYIWTVSSGGTITAGGSTSSRTVTVTWNSATPQTVSVNYTDNNGCTAAVATTLNVTVNPRPTPTITGPSSACLNSTNNNYVTETGMTGYSWTVTGGTITSGVGTSSIEVTWTTFGSQTVSVNYDNLDGCAALSATVYNVTVNSLPTPTITGPSSVCVTSTGNVYSTQSGYSDYIWLVSSGGTITAGGGTGDNTVTVTWNTQGTQTVSVNYTNGNGCTAASPFVYSVTVHPLPVPTITGQTNLCVNSGYYNYSTEASMLNYVWMVSSGGVINYGSGTDEIQVSWVVAGAQTVSVSYSSPYGCGSAAPTVLNVTVNPLPDPAGAITGSSEVCAGAKGVAYSVGTIANANTYVWSLPPNASIASGAGTKSITVDFADNATSGDIIVYGNNVCGDGQNSPAFAVTVDPLPAAAGNILGPNNVCIGATGVIYSVPAIAHATGYTWTVPSGITIVSGTNTDSITVNITTLAISGPITVMGTNSCGDGTVSPNFEVTVNPIPATPVITNSGDTLHSNAPSGNQWYFNGSIILGATSQKYVATLSGHYWDVVDLHGCSSDTSNHLYIIITGIQPQPASVINLYPVPNDGRFNVSITTPSQESFSFRVYNDLGVKIYEEANVEVTGSTVKVIDLRPVPNGMYTVIITSNSERIVKRIVINY